MSLPMWWPEVPELGGVEDAPVIESRPARATRPPSYLDDYEW